MLTFTLIFKRLTLLFPLALAAAPAWGQIPAGAAFVTTLASLARAPRPEVNCMECAMRRDGVPASSLGAEAARRLLSDVSPILQPSQLVRPLALAPLTETEQTLPGGLRMPAWATGGGLSLEGMAPRFESQVLGRTFGVAAPAPQQPGNYTLGVPFAPGPLPLSFAPTWPNRMMVPNGMMF